MNSEDTHQLVDTPLNHLELARRVINIEIEELNRLGGRIGESFSKAVDVLKDTLAATRKIVVCGVGKSGSIARKLVATLNSTGATSLNLNAQDALHGDLGVVDDGDVLILLSYSGETRELLDLLPHLKRMQVTLIGITGNVDSALAKHSDIILDVHVEREACPLGLAPTSSTTSMLVLCDALAMVLLEVRGFSQNDFAKFHPNGSLGKALLTKVSDVMRAGDLMAIVTPKDTIRTALEAMTKARAGAAIVVDMEGKVAGIFTHGDFVRAFQTEPMIADKAVESYMTRSPLTITKNTLATEVLALLELKRVDDLVVVDDDGKPAGLVDTQDLTRLKWV